MSHIYLAGPITGLHYDAATDWREAWAPAFRSIGFTTASPMRGKEHLKHTGVLTGVFDEGKAAVERDEYDIRHCDIFLANFEGAQWASIGTCCELGLAYALRKHVVTVMPSPEVADKAGIGENVPRGADNVHDHIFIQEWSSIIVPDMSSAFEWIRQINPPRNAFIT